MSVALVVMVLTILLGFVNGMRSTVTGAADRNNWMLLERGVLVEAGGMDHQTLEVLRVRPEIATDAAGDPLFSPEIVVGFDPTADSPRASTGILRAVHPIAYKVHKNFRIVAGHIPERGKNQWIVGQRLAARFPNLGLGQKFHWWRGDWTISGIFSDNGSVRESEAWADLDDIATVLHIPPGSLGANSVHLVLKPASSDTLAAATRGDNRLRVDLMTEQAFYSGAAGFSNRLRSLGLVVASILAIGAIFGAMNTMYSAVARRRREVGTLRVLGFGRGSVLTAFVFESAILGAAGGVIGGMLAAAVALCTGLDSRLMNVGNILFSFRLAPSAFAVGLVAAIAIGVAGGMLPAWQASRLDLIDSLRD